MNLVLFFTRGQSVKSWLDNGIFDREKLIYESYVREGWQVIWVTYNYLDFQILSELKKQGKIPNEVSVVSKPKYLPGKLGDLLFSFVAVFLHLKKLKEATILKTNQMDGAWTALIASKFLKKPLFVRTGYTWSHFYKHSPHFNKLKWFIIRGLEHYACLQADIFSVTSSHDKEYLTTFCGKVSECIRIIPNYINIERFYNKKLERNSDRLLFVGRLIKQKNLQNLIKSLKRCRIGLDIYGNGPLKNELLDLSQRLNVDCKIYPPIANDELATVYNSYTFFILPSLYEGLPKVLLEAMACGCICIGTDVVGIKEIIRNNENGFLAKSTEVPALIEALEQLTSQKNNSQLSENAEKTIIEGYSLNTIYRKEQSWIQTFL